MNVLQIHSSDYLGGGGGTVAMERLHRGLRDNGIDSKILSAHKTSESPYSQAIPQPAKLHLVENYLHKVTAGLGLNDLHYLHSFRLKQARFFREADLVHIHGTHGFFNYLAIPGLTHVKPTVFTLHDMWALTGHCGYSYGCDRWKTGCGACPHLDVHPAVKRDNTRLEWKLKQHVFKLADLAIITLSTWLTEMARQSILGHLPIYHIPNGVDTDIFQPLDREQCRALLHIPAGKKVLMFVALRLDDYRKGGDLLLKSLQSLPDSLKKDTILLLLGNHGEAVADAVGMETINLGYVRNDRLKAVAYAAADLFLCPTRADNLPLVLQESMACGTPLLSFRVGGVPDLVRPGITGHLAEPEDAAGLAQGILHLLEDEPLRQALSWRCREIALAEYSLSMQVDRHLTLYRALLAQKQPASQSPAPGAMGAAPARM